MRDGHFVPERRASQVLDVLARRCTALTIWGAAVFGAAWFWLVWSADAAFAWSMSGGVEGWESPAWIAWLAVVVGIGGLVALLVAFAGSVAGLASPRRRTMRPLEVWIADLVVASPIGVVAIAAGLGLIAWYTPVG